MVALDSGSLYVTGKEPVFASYHEGSYRIFRQVVIHAESAVLKIFFQPRPLPECVVDCLAKKTLWRNLDRVLHEPAVKGINKRLGFLLPQMINLSRGQLPITGVFFDSVELSDTFHRLFGNADFLL
jgi:hypothetical protein